MSFEKYLREDCLSENTIKKHLTNIRIYKKWLDEKKYKNEDLLIINEFISDLGESSEVNTVNSYCTSLKKYYSYNKGMNIDTRKIRLLRGVNNHTLPNNLSKKDIEKYLRTIKITEKNQERQLRNTLIVELMLKAGLRISEVKNIKTNDIDISNKTLYIRMSKGGVSRKIPMHHSLEKLLRLYPMKKNEELFSISDRAIRDIIYKYAKIIEKDISPHSLRHTFAIRLRQEGEKLENISYLLGHANIETTRIYLRVSEEILRDTINLI